jgi:hypothetical protein
VFYRFFQSLTWFYLHHQYRILARP